MVLLAPEMARMARIRLDQPEGATIIATPEEAIAALGDNLPLTLLSSLVDASDAGSHAVLHADGRLETY